MATFNLSVRSNSETVQMPLGRLVRLTVLVHIAASLISVAIKQLTPLYFDAIENF